MFILYAVIVGIVVGLALGGRLAGLASIDFRWAPLILVGFLVQIVLFTDAVASRVGAAGPVIYVGSTLLVGAAVLRNLRLPGMPLILLGALSNMAAILANGGFMPAAPGAMAALGKDAPTIYSNSAVLTEPALAPLIDQFALPRWLPFANVFSVGDAVLAAGVVVLIVVAMRRAPREVRRGAKEQLPLSS
jgi:Family of unknown function (DUF5317)